MGTLEPHIPFELARNLAALAGRDRALEDAERAALSGRVSVDLAKLAPSLARDVRANFASSDHVVVRGLPVDGGGVVLIWLLAVVSDVLKSYRTDKVLKQFSLSPWTTALSHTLAEGHFHTDLNTADVVPAVTGIMCLRPDPAAPEAGVLRVARLRDLLRELRARDEKAALAFLLDTDVSMVNDTSPAVWTGRISDGVFVRFHPETIRAAERRAGRSDCRFEAELAVVKAVALAVSHPISLSTGDALLVSNSRALHYRGACTVRFIRFPREFEAREVCVAHGMDERWTR